MDSQWPQLFTHIETPEQDTRIIGFETDYSTDAFIKLEEDDEGEPEVTSELRFRDYEPEHDTDNLKDY